MLCHRVDVDLARYPLRRMAECLADDLHGNTHRKEQRAGRVTEFVRRPRSESCTLADLAETVAEIVGIDRCAHWRREDEPPLIRPSCAQSKPLDCLRGPVGTQEVNELGWQVQCATALVGLQVDKHEASSDPPLQLSTDSHPPR